LTISVSILDIRIGMTCLAKFLGRNPVISMGICRIEVHHTDFSHVQVGQTNLNELV